MERLHNKDMIENTVGKIKSIVLTNEGLKRCQELFNRHFREIKVTTRDKGRATKLPRHLRSQTEFGNEGIQSGTALQDFVLSVNFV